MVCKESVVQEMSRVDFDEQLKNSTVILIDVAGTTTALSFIKETLFPYVTDNVKTYLSDNWDKESIIELLNKLREECSDLPSKDEVAAGAADKDKQLEKFVEYIIKKTQENSESIPIKTIQGLVYEHGYTKGLLKGHVFEDVGVALESWSRGNKRRVCVYSSGSIESQKLLFGWSSAGDLTSHINTHFDQSDVGAKTDALSYKNIATKLDCKPEAIVFLTDSVEEAKAASEAGVNAVLVSREGNTPITDEHKKLFPIVNSFKELPLNELEVNVVESADTAAGAVATESSQVKVEQTAVADTNEVDSDVSAKRKLPTDDEPQTETEPPTKIAKTEETNDKVIKEDEKVVEVNKVESTTTTVAEEQENKSETKTDDKQSTTEAVTTVTNSSAEAMEGVEEETTAVVASTVSKDDIIDDKKRNEEIKGETKENNKETAEVLNNSSDKIETKVPSSDEVSDSVTSTEPATGSAPAPVTEVESMEVDEESPSTETTNTEVSTTTEKKSTESKGTQVAIKVSNNDVASQAEMGPKDLDDKKVENEATPVVKPEAAATPVTTITDKERSTEVTEKQSEVVSTVDTTEPVKEEVKNSNPKDQLAETKSSSNEEVKTSSSVEATEKDTKNDDKPQSTTAVKEGDGEGADIKKQNAELIIEKPDTTTTNAEEKVETKINGSSNSVDMKIEEKPITTTTEEETKADEKKPKSSTSTNNANDVIVESEQKQQETENNKITSEEETKKTEEVKTLKKDDNETEIIKKSEVETKQTDDNVPENTKEVKENGSNKTETLETSTTCEKKTEQKTEKLDATKSNGANGVEGDATKSNNKNGVTNGDDTNKNGSNDTSTSNSITTSTVTDDDSTKTPSNSSTTTEIKVKTVSDVVGAVAAEGAVDVVVTTAKE